MTVKQTSVLVHMQSWCTHPFQTHPLLAEINTDTLLLFRDSTLFNMNKALVCAVFILLVLSVFTEAMEGNPLNPNGKVRTKISVLVNY
jgi:hypothetical protein